MNPFCCKLVDIHRVSLVQVKHVEQASVASSDHHCHMACLRLRLMLLNTLARLWQLLVFHFSFYSLTLWFQ